MKKDFFTCLSLLAVMTVLTGVFYPLAVTGITQIFLPHKANGSMIERNEKIIGSELIGQKFVSGKYFHSRPSAIDYNPLPSGGSNFGPTSKALQNSMKANKARFLQQNRLSSNTVIPIEMLFASASGLDPHISPEAAFLQIAQIARARGLDSTKIIQVYTLVHQFTESSQWNMFGQERVNVLKLNLALDRELP
jgi:potassium-transporting ATPase KdpC subunit